MFDETLQDLHAKTLSIFRETSQRSSQSFYRDNNNNHNNNEKLITNVAEILLKFNSSPQQWKQIVKTKVFLFLFFRYFLTIFFLY